MKDLQKKINYSNDAQNGKSEEVGKQGMGCGWKVSASNLAKNTFNPIRNILETMKITPNPEKKMISLSIGDPTIFGNLKPSPVAIRAITESMQSGKYNGYAPSTGFPEARQAVADHVSMGGNDISADDVILCSGCSCSLDLCISVLANPGQNILVPRPGFPLYKTLANGLGIETREYDLLPEHGWECNLEQMESLIDGKTAAILINNPSNPCGSVFSKAHLLRILEIAERNHLPIIADEIYEHFVFKGSDRSYVPIASLTETVPVLCCGGLTKRYLVPGWRLGWITVHDRNNILSDGGVRKGLNCLSQRIIGSNTLVQGALRTILEETPQSFYEETLDTIQKSANLAFERLSRVPGLNPIKPEGAMYMMVGVDRANFPAFDNDLQIVEAMVKEQSVFCLPGKCFSIDDFFRIVLTVPEEMMEEACDRIEEFCQAHFRSSKAAVKPISRPMVGAGYSSSSSFSSSDEDEDEIDATSRRGQNVQGHKVDISDDGGKISSYLNPSKAGKGVANQIQFRKTSFNVRLA